MYEAHRLNEVIFILDDGCIINFKREISLWFRELINEFSDTGYPIFCCASRYSIAHQNRPFSEKFYFIELNELNINERKRLLSQLLNLYCIEISKTNFADVAALLYGLPEQVMYAVDLIKDSKFINFNDNLSLLQDYNTDKASAIIQSYESNPDAMDFIRLLAQFEVITTDFLFSIVDENKFINILEDITSENICELMGNSGDLVRLNDIIRDYIKRNRLEIREDYLEKIKRLVTEIAHEDDIFERDSSEYIFAIKEVLKSGDKIDQKLLIPSHYLRCIEDLYYNRGQLEKVISLADTILQKESTLDPDMVQELRYYLCLALAKKKDKRLLKEVQNIKGDQHSFILGFYYRQCGRIKDALDRLLPIVDAKYVGAKCKREIVQVYLQSEDYEKALQFAKKNYEENKSNQFHNQAYFHCLINSEEKFSKKTTLLNLIQNLIEINSDQSLEMAGNAQALYSAKIENNKQKAFDQIDDCIAAFPDNHYPLFTKCDIALIYRDYELLDESIGKLEALNKRRHFSQKTLTKYQAYSYALQKDIKKAIKLLQNDLSRFPEDSKNRLLDKINLLAK